LLRILKFCQICYGQKRDEILVFLYIAGFEQIRQVFTWGLSFWDRAGKIATAFVTDITSVCTREEVRRLARRRKRKSRRRQEGRRILEQVPQFSIESGEDKPVTAARNYIKAEGITPPALLLVKRNEHTTDRYFWAEKGLFGAQYVEENHFLFPSLRSLEPETESQQLVTVGSSTY
jgi:Protein of unknown function (DUF3155)